MTVFLALIRSAVLQDLDGDVPDHAGAHDAQHDPELDIDADLGLENEGKNEPHGFPQSVVGEGSLFFVFEEDPVYSCKKDRKTHFMQTNNVFTQRLVTLGASRVPSFFINA